MSKSLKPIEANMTFDEWSDNLLVLCLKNEEVTEQEFSDLEKLCAGGDLKFSDEWAVRFINEQKQYGQGVGNTIVGYDFSLSLDGRYVARGILEKKQARTFMGVIKATPRSDWISLAAFVVSFIALLKS